MKYPRISIDTGKIAYNTRVMVKLCHDLGISVAGVTKLVCGDPRIAGVFVENGVDLLADSRIENLRKLSDINLPKLLLRIPMASQAQEIVTYSDMALVSEPATVEALSREAVKAGKMYKVILMVDLGDLREGIYRENEVYRAVEIIDSMPGISLEGVGANLTCYGGVIPSWDNLSRLVKWKEDIESRRGRPLKVISGGNGSTLHLMNSTGMPSQINQLRLGSALTMGIGLNDQPIKGLYQDAFTLEAEMIEIREKPSKPVGEIGLDAFGNKPVFVDKGMRRRAICAIGRQDIHPDHLSPWDCDIQVLGASSDHLLLDINDTSQHYEIGDTLGFSITYGGCLAAMTSDYVHKHYL